MQPFKTLRSHGIVLIWALVLQYIIGMVSNLYVTFPENVSDTQQWEYAKSQFVIMSHIALGMLLLVGSIALFVRAMRRHDHIWKVASGIGLGSILLAIVSGSEFISKQTEMYSFAMAVFFVISFVSFGWGVYKTKS